MKAIIELDVPKWQIEKSVTVHFPNSMMKRGKCELYEEKELNIAHKILAEATLMYRGKEFVQCKDCILRHTDKCVLFDQAFPVNKGNDWFCADGVRSVKQYD